jgi:two-component system, NarL family, invasion response regulator UvrY
MPLKVLIVDDHPIMRVGVRQLIQQAWADADIVEAPTLEEALSAFAARPADVVVLDLSLPDAQGTEGAARMLRVAKETPILVLSMNAEPPYAMRLIQMGVSGYLSKDRAGDELVTAVRRLLDGGRYVTPTMTEHLLGMLSGKAPQALPHERLSSQEYRVMQLIAAGSSPAQIAEVMHLSVKTVSSYRARILEKAGWKNNTELTKYCLHHGLTQPL